MLIATHMTAGHAARIPYGKAAEALTPTQLLADIGTFNDNTISRVRERQRIASLFYSLRFTSESTISKACEIADEETHGDPSDSLWHGMNIFFLLVYRYETYPSLPASDLELLKYAMLPPVHGQYPRTYPWFISASKWQLYPIELTYFDLWDQNLEHLHDEFVVFPRRWNPAGGTNLSGHIKQFEHAPNANAIVRGVRATTLWLYSGKTTVLASLRTHGRYLRWLATAPTSTINFAFNELVTSCFDHPPQGLWNASMLYLMLAFRFEGSSIKKRYHRVFGGLTQAHTSGALPWLEDDHGCWELAPFDVEFYSGFKNIDITQLYNAFKSCPRRFVVPPQHHLH